MPAAKGMPRGCRQVWGWAATPGLVLTSGDLVQMPSTRKAVFVGVHDKRRDVVLYEFEYIDPDPAAPPPRQGGDRELSMRVTMRDVSKVKRCPS